MTTDNTQGFNQTELEILNGEIAKLVADGMTEAEASDRVSNCASDLLEETKTYNAAWAQDAV